MLKRAGIFLSTLFLVSALFLILHDQAFALDETDQAIHKLQIKPSDVLIPAGVPIGQYQRVIRPFPNWNLICDENLKSKRRVCNISQIIVSDRGDVVFSWSLAARENGEPLFILRAPAALGVHSIIHLGLHDGGQMVSVKISECNQIVCIAYQPVGPRLRTALKNGKRVDVAFGDQASGYPDMILPLDGLFAALSSIRG